MGEGDIASESREREKAILKGSEPTPVEKMVSRAERIQSLSLEPQFDERLKEMDELIQRGVFVLDTPMATHEAVLNTLTDEQLQMASEYREPTLLVIPKVSFRAKVRALETTVSIAQEQIKLGFEGLSEAEKAKALEILAWEKPEVAEDYFSQDTGSERIVGWEARVVEGKGVWGSSRNMGSKEDYLRDIKEKWIRNKIFKKEPLPSKIVKQLKWRHENGEREIDLHAYAMLAVVSLLQGEPIDNYEKNSDVRARFTVLSDELGDIANLKESSPDGFDELAIFNEELSNRSGETADIEKKSPVACWSDARHRFVFGFVKAGFNINKRYRRSVGGEVKNG